MRINTNQKFQSNIMISIIVILYLSACGLSQRDQDVIGNDNADAVVPTRTTEVRSTATKSPLPTQTLLPTPTPQLYSENIDIPECIPEEEQDEFLIGDLTFESTLAEMDSYRYRTIYRYKSGSEYPEDELALEIQGEHSGLLSEPYSPFIEFPSQSYKRSHIIVTDLHSMSQIEAIITEEGIWIRDINDSGWIELTHGNPSQLVNLTERFSPYEVRWFVIGSVPSDVKMMKSEISIAGLEVIHRCYKPDPYPDSPEPFNDVNFILPHWDNIFTGLQDAELHLWTSNDDSQLLRLAVKGKQVVDSYFEYGYLVHEPPNDFLLYVELIEMNQPIEIDSPGVDEVIINIPDNNVIQVRDSGMPFDQIPLPPDAKLVSESEYEWIEKAWSSVEEEGITRENVKLFKPRDLIGWENEFHNSVMYAKYGSNWYEIPLERRPVYETEMDTMDLVQFFAKNMPDSGWTLDDAYFQLGNPKYFLFFTRDKVIMPIILEYVGDKKSHINAFLPPDDALLEIILKGWESFDESNSVLIGNKRKTIAFDGNGSVWIGELDGGVSVFDGTTWMKYTNSISELIGNDVWAIEFDRDGQAWISSRDALYNIDGEDLTSYSEDDYHVGLIKDIKIDDFGNVWISGGAFITANEISVFDGQAWQTIRHLDPIIAFDIDADGLLLITTGDGVYSLDGDSWIELFASEEDTDNLNLSNLIGLQYDGIGRLWIASRSGELMMFDGESWTSYNPKDSGLDVGIVEDMVLDQLDRVWLVTFSGGVYMFDTKEGWVNFSPDPIGISVEYPDAMKVDQKGRIWFASGQGVAVFTPPEP
jgi:streptogramin lyase